MCAMMPMFRNLPRSYLAIFDLGTHASSALATPEACAPLPFVMSECLIGVRHTMRIFFLLYGVNAFISRLKQLRRQPIRHGFFTPTAGVGYDPTNRQGTAPFLVNFNWNLIGGSSDTTRLDFDRRPDVINRALKYFQRLFAGLFANLSQRVIKGPFRQ